MSDNKKWIAPTDEMKRRFCYHILINNEVYSVYDIEEAYHSLGSANGSGYEDHYFIRYSDQWVPFVSKGVHRLCWEINYKQSNSAKHKWDEWQFSSRGSCEMKINGKLIYQFNSYSLNFALSKAQYLTVALMEFPGFNFLEPEKENGRKVWWYGLPATIKSKSSYPWEIVVYPDYSDIQMEEWWKLYRIKTAKEGDKDKERSEEDRQDFDEDLSSRSINWGDAFEAGGRIDWFRK